MSEYAVIGKPVPKADSWIKATGEARYVADLGLPHMLWGKVLRSPFAHARIRHIDTSRAERLAGVKAVITGRDIPPVKYGIVPLAADEYALAIDKVRYIGDDVAAVAAVDPDIAEEALGLIRVEYEELPAVFDPEEAMRPEAPVIHDGIKNNVSAKLVKSFGDLEKGFQESDHVREDRFQTQAVNHAPMEPHGAMAEFHPDGTVTLWSSTQIPFFLRRNLAKAMAIPESKVRIIKPHVGGGFGGKIDLFAKDFCAAYLSRLTGRPVKIVYNREEVFLSTRQRHPMVLLVKTGVKRDGTLMAQEMKLIADGGAYNSTAPLIITLSVYFLMIPYIIPNLKFEGRHVYTNKPVGGAMRGHGIPQVRFAVESQLDLLAADLGIDPVELRQKNALYVGYSHPAKYEINTCGFIEAIQQTAQKVGWKEKKERLARYTDGSTRYGMGIACSSFPCGVKNMRHIGSGAIIEINVDGGINLLSGAADIGQGAENVIAMIAAEELGVAAEDIRVTAADTGLTPLDAGTFGSGVTFRAGNAAKAAAADAKRQIREIVAQKLEANPEDIEFREGRIYVKGSPEKGMTFKEGVKAYQYADRPMPVVGRGFFMPDALEPTTLANTEGNFSPAYTFMAQATEVEIDRETGQVQILQVVTAHDSGFVINPLNVEGQLEGSVAGGLGQALLEDLPEEGGQYLNPSFTDYRMATAVDVPSQMISIPIETIEPEGPFGAKESGEGNQVATAPAIANAIADALQVRINDLPITPEKILLALEKGRADKGAETRQ
ncbi:MAG: molybdopterin-dependent oxidoreductase [Chloroflexi bacterium]|nr:molybdopterin-dependent oxidoreductase [Chloroflexota bacterium]